VAIGLVDYTIGENDLGGPIKWDDITDMVCVNECVTARAALLDPLAYLLTDQEIEAAERTLVRTRRRLVSMTRCDASDAVCADMTSLQSVTYLTEMLDNGGVEGLWIAEINRLADEMVQANYTVGLPGEQPEHLVFRLKTKPLAQPSAGTWRMFVEATLCAAALDLSMNGKKKYMPDSLARARATYMGYVTQLVENTRFVAGESRQDTERTWCDNINAAAKAYNATFS